MLKLLLFFFLDGYNNDGTKAPKRNRSYISNSSIDCLFEEDVPLYIQLKRNF